MANTCGQHWVRSRSSPLCPTPTCIIRSSVRSLSVTELSNPSTFSWGFVTNHLLRGVGAVSVRATRPINLANAYGESNLGFQQAAFKPIGDFYQRMADSNTPLSLPAKATQDLWHSAVEIPMEDFTSAAGDLTKGRFPGVISNAVSGVFNPDAQKQVDEMATGYATDMGNAVYHATNGDLDAARAAAAALLTKFKEDPNYLNSYAGLQAYAELPAIAQLGIQLISPANKLMDFALAGTVPKGFENIPGVEKYVQGPAQYIAPLAAFKTAGLGGCRWRGRRLFHRRPVHR